MILSSLLADRTLHGQRRLLHKFAGEGAPRSTRAGARRSPLGIGAIVGLVLAPHLSGAAEEYDPLATEPVDIETIRLEIEDTERQRELPVRVDLPAEDDRPAPVVLFSHGLGGSRDNNTYLGEHWARRGYVAVFLQHPGSDESLWRGQRGGEAILKALAKGATLEQLLLRYDDVPAVIDALERFNGTRNHPLEGRLDLDSIGMSGHSFGAITTQGVSGQALPGGQRRWLEPRIDAAVVMSPSPPGWGRPEKAFAEVEIPWLLMTGTDDESPLGRRTSPEDRLKVFPHLEKSPAWQLVFHEGDHMVFGDRAIRRQDPAEKARRTRRHRAIQAVTTAFWDAFLRDQTAAADWLRGEQFRQLLEAEDQWSFNEVDSL